MDFIKENKNLIYSAILFLCIFLIYIVVVKGVFFFDDDTFVRLNSSISEGKPFYEYFTSHVLDGANLPSNFYRPLQVILGRLIFIFWGLNSFYFHFIQIAIHSFNGVLVFYLLNKLGFKKEHSFIAALLFGIHPVLTESVSYISGLADPLYLMFTLLAALSFLRVLHSKSNKVIYSIITLLMILLALFSRETAVISFLFLVLIFLYDRNSRKDEGFFNNKYALTTLFISFVLSVIYLLLRFTILKFTENIGLNKDTNEYTESLLIRIVTFVSILWDYFVLIIFPKNLNYEKPYTAYAVIDTTRFIFGFLWILLSIVFSYFSFRKKGVFWLGVLNQQRGTVLRQ